MDNATRKDLIKDYSLKTPKRLCGLYFPLPLKAGATTDMTSTYELCNKAVIENCHCIYAKAFILSVVNECTAGEI